MKETNQHDFKLQKYRTETEIFLNIKYYTSWAGKRTKESTCPSCEPAIDMGQEKNQEVNQPILPMIQPACKLRDKNSHHYFPGRQLT